MKKIFVLVSGLALLPAVALAENTLGTPVKEPNQIIEFIQTISSWVFAILLAVSVLYILLAAWQYLTSKGGEGVEKAHKMLAYAAVGIAVAVLAKGIVFTVRKLVDRDSKPVSSINLIIPNYYA